MNTAGPLRMAKALLPNLERGRRRTIVSLTSGLGSISQNNGGWYEYRASKAALNMLDAHARRRARAGAIHLRRPLPRLGPDGHGRQRGNADAAGERARDAPGHRRIDTEGQRKVPGSSRQRGALVSPPHLPLPRARGRGVTLAHSTDWRVACGAVLRMARKTTESEPGPKRPAARGARAARIVWIGLAVVAGLAIVLAVAGSVALHSVLASGKVKEWVNGEPEKLRIEYVSASDGIRGRSTSRDWSFAAAIRTSSSGFASRTPGSPFRRSSSSPIDSTSAGSRAAASTYRLRLRADPKKTDAAHFAALAADPRLRTAAAAARGTDPGGRSGRSEEKGGVEPPAVPSRSTSTTSGSTRCREVWIELYRHHGGTGTLAGLLLSRSTSPRAGRSRTPGAFGRRAFARHAHALLRPASFDDDRHHPAVRPAGRARATRSGRSSRGTCARGSRRRPRFPQLLPRRR